jgi:hypothetical protein
MRYAAILKALAWLMWQAAPPALNFQCDLGGCSEPGPKLTYFRATYVVIAAITKLVAQISMR